MLSIYYHVIYITWAIQYTNNSTCFFLYIDLWDCTQIHRKLERFDVDMSAEVKIGVVNHERVGDE